MRGERKKITRSRVGAHARALAVLCMVLVFAGAPHARAQEALPADPFASSDIGAAPQAIPQAIPAPPQAGESRTALPSGYDVNARAPGMQLSDDELFDPFAAPPPAPVQTAEEIEREIRTRAYNAAITGLMPMRPDEIRRLLETYDQTQQAVEVPIFPYPTPQTAVETVALDPGVAPPEIKVAVGHVTTVSMLDITGAPWPIQDVAWAGNFELIQPEDGGNMLRISPQSHFTHGNISIRLIGLNTPVIFTLRTHRDVVQYRLDARIPQYGPNARVPIVDGGVSLAAGNSVMSAILDGVPPAGALRMDVDGVDGRTSAWAVNGMTYLRSPLTLLSPGWNSSVSSGDGMNVYELRNAPVVLLSDEGRVVRAALSERNMQP